MNDSDKTKEHLLRESEARYKAIFESAREGIIVGNIETRQFMYANPAICKMFGYTAEEMTRLAVNDIHPREHLQYASDRFKAFMQGEAVFTPSMPCLRKDGTFFYADISATHIVINNKEGFVGFFTDTTERKNAEDALRESEARYKAIFNYATEGIVVTDVVTKRHKYANPAFCRMFGYTAEEIQQMTVYDIHPKEYMTSVIDGLEAQARGEKTLVPNVPCLHKNGAVFYADIDATCVVIDQRPCNVGLFTNITERKRAEEALRESEQKYRLLVEQLPAITFTASLDEIGTTLYISPQSHEILGVSPDEFKADPKLWQKMIHPDDHDRIMAEVARTQRTGEPLSCEYRLRAKNGRIVWARDNAKIIRDDQGSALYLQGVMYDITASKHAEEALRESEEKFRGLAERSFDVILMMDNNGYIKYISPACERMTGFKPEEMIDKNFRDFVTEAYLQPTIEYYAGTLKGKALKTLMSEVKRKDNTHVFVEANMSPVLQNGKVVGAQGVVRDITERKKNEELLRQSEEKFRGIAERSFDMIFTTDARGFITYLSPASERIFGCEPQEMVGKNFVNFLVESEIPKAVKRFTEKMQGKKLGDLCLEAKKKDGSRVFIELISSLVIQDGKTAGTQGIIKDITERKKTEEQLKQSEEKFRGFAERSSDMIFMTDKKGYLTYASPACEKIFGYKPEEMVGRTNTDFVIKSELPRLRKRFVERLRGKDYGTVSYEIKRKDGSTGFIELNPYLIKKDGKVLATHGVIKDITERRKAEERLQKAHEELETRVKKRTADLAKAVETLQKEIAERKIAEESLRSAEVRFGSIFENTIVGLYRTTPSGQILLANPALVKMMGCRSFKELAKFNVEKNGFDPSTPRSIFKEHIKKEGRVIGLECVWRRPDGTKLFVSESAFAVKDAKGKILYYEGTAQDITQRKEAEEKLMLYQQQLRSLASELSLAEERLRRRIAAELHDHIAQNLAISKIKLESLTDDTESEQSKSLKEVIHLISKTIDASRTLTFEISPPVLYELGFEAAVGWLTRQTRQRFGLDVEFINDEKPKPLNTDIRVLLFQAVRELLVNVVKHAKAQKAKIYANVIGNNIQVTVEDNGIGFDTATLNLSKDFTKGGFGLFNIRERLDQIGGSVIIHSGRNKGTKIIMTAPIEKQKKTRTRFSDTRSEKSGRRRKSKK
jgi:PAS domain S-box-containing protein